MTRRDLEKLRVALRGLSRGNLLVIAKAGDRTRAKGQTRVPIVYTEGVSKRGMSLERFVAVTATKRREGPRPLPPEGRDRPRQRRRPRRFRPVSAKDARRGRPARPRLQRLGRLGGPRLAGGRACCGARSSSTGASSAGRIDRMKALSALSVPRELGGGPPWRTPVSRRHPAGEGERHASGSRSPSGCHGSCSGRDAQSRTDREGPVRARRRGGDHRLRKTSYA